MFAQLPTWAWFIPLGVYILYVFGRTIYEWLIVPSKIKFSQMKTVHHEKLEEPIGGDSLSGGIDITIPKDWILIDCYVTLEKVVPIYYQDRILIDDKKSAFHSTLLEPEYKRLRWKSPLAGNDCKINIGENRNTESILIGRTLRGDKIPLRKFEYCLCSTADPKQFEPKRLGLYEISIILHWYRNGIKREKEFDGYIYSEVIDNMSRITVGEGDYNENPYIPKPILMM